jgi:hypothetical protein
LSDLSADNADPILDFYTTRANEVYRSRNPVNAGVNYSFSAKTYYYIIENNGYLRRNDSSITKYFYSFGDRDSTIEIVSSKNKQEQLNFNYLNIFNKDYLFNFFPNDTGGENISIGFDSKVFSYEQPVGFVILNRDLYFMRMLHLYYNHERRDKRISKSYRFIEYEGFVFPDSIWEIKAKRGILSVDYYRTETGITDIQIYR